MAIFTIEVNNSTNGGHVWMITKDNLRGRWDFGRTAHRNISQSAEGTKQLARVVRTIPGMFIQVDTEKWIGRIFDPLKETEEGREIFAKITQVYKQYESEFGLGRVGLVDAREFVFNDANELKEWMYRMRQAVDSKNASAVGDEMPSIRDIEKAPGGILNNLGSDVDTKPKEDPNDNRPIKYRNVVKVPPNYRPKREEEAPASAD